MSRAVRQKVQMVSPVALANRIAGLDVPRIDVGCCHLPDMTRGGAGSSQKGGGWRTARPTTPPDTPSHQTRVTTGR